MTTFDVSNGYVLPLIICRLFLLPRVIAEFRACEAIEAFFGDAGLKPARVALNTPRGA